MALISLRQVGAGKVGVAVVLAMQGQGGPLVQNALPRHADRYDDGSDGAADAGVRFAQLRLPLPLMPPRPGHVEYRLRANGLDLLVEKPDVFVHPARILQRQRTLFLQDDVIPLR